MKFVFIQQRMMAGTEPSSNRPGARTGVPIGDREESPIAYEVSKFKLFARPEAAERIECTELALPSDLCEPLRSFIERPPRPLPALGK